MVSTRKKGQSNRRLLSQLDEFDQDVFVGNAMNYEQKNTMVNEGTVYLDFTVGNSDSGQNFNENMVIVKTLERCFIKGIDRKMGNFDDTVKNRIQKSHRD